MLLSVLRSEIAALVGWLLVGVGGFLGGFATLVGPDDRTDDEDDDGPAAAARWS